MDQRAVDQSMQTGKYPLSRLGDELSAVINRVRQAFGPIPMWEAAARSQVVQAERAVNLVAGQLQRGESDMAAWHRALCHYERTWMSLLDELRGAAAKRHAA